MSRSGVTAARLQVLAAALLFSTGGAAIKAAAFTGWQVAGARSLIAAVALTLLRPASLRRLSAGTTAVGCAYAGALVCYALANKLTTAASTIFLTSTAPLFILLLAPWLLGERLRRRDGPFMLAIAAGLGLVFLDLEVVGATAPRPLAGNLLALGAGLSFALVVMGLRWLGRNRDEGSEATAAVITGNLMAGLLCLPMALPWAEGATRDWAVVVYLGVLQVGLAYVFLTTGLRRIGALEASLLLLIEPVLNPLWAWWLHGERPGRWVWAGGAVILAATALRVFVGRGGRLRRGADSGGRAGARDR